MAYRVFWAPVAELQLKRIVGTVPDTKVVSAAAREMNHRLATDPYQVSESRDYPLRICIQLPLASMIEIMNDVRTVIVHNLWWAARN